MQAVHSTSNTTNQCSCPAAHCTSAALNGKGGLTWPSSKDPEWQQSAVQAVWERSSKVHGRLMQHSSLTLHALSKSACRSHMGMSILVRMPENGSYLL